MITRVKEHTEETPKKYYRHSKDTEMVCETVVPYRWSGMDDRLVFKMETIKTFLNNKSLTFISSDTQNDNEMLISSIFLINLTFKVTFQWLCFKVDQKKKTI